MDELQWERKMPISPTEIESIGNGVVEELLEQKLRRAESDLSDLKERYQHLVAGTHGLICTHDMEGVLLTINPAACESLGYDSSEIIGHNLSEFITPSRREYFRIFLDRISQNAVDKGILNLVARNGRELTFQYHNIKITNNEAEPYVLGYAYDITELTELQKKLKELTVTDELTGLTNRRGFLDRANTRMQLAQRFGERLLLIFADVDGLKGINDKFGHALGSQAIIDTADILRDSFRGSDVISRIGGDEFVVLLAHAAEASVEVICERVLKNIRAFNASSCRPYTLSFSIGVAPVETEGELSLESIIANADKSMYENKREKTLADKEHQ